MQNDLRDLQKLLHTNVETDQGPATVREYMSPNRFDAVRASVNWTSSGANRWGSVRRDREMYIASLYEKIERRELLVLA